MLPRVCVMVEKVVSGLANGTDATGSAEAMNSKLSESDADQYRGLVEASKCYDCPADH